MNSNNRCMRQKHFGFFGRASIAAAHAEYSDRLPGLYACPPPGVDHKMKRSIKYLCLLAVLISAVAAIAADPAGRPVSAAEPTADSAQAKAKLTQIRGRSSAV